jgi:hypothetical protein
MPQATERTRNKDTNSRRGDTRYDFTPIDYDGEIAPDAAEGEYEAKIVGVRVQPTNKDRYPLLIIDWKLESTTTETEEAEKSVGAVVSDLITFWPAGNRTRGAQMSARQWRHLRELLDIPQDILPNKIKAIADFAELLELLEGTEATIHIFVSTDKRSNEDQAKVSYTEPRGTKRMGAMKGLDEEESEEDEDPDSEDEEPEEEEEPEPRKKKTTARARR